MILEDFGQSNEIKQSGTQVFRLLTLDCAFLAILASKWLNILNISFGIKIIIIIIQYP